MILCPHCSSDDVALQDSKPLKNDMTIAYRFTVWVCTFMCHACGHEFEKDLEPEERKHYL